MVGSRSVIRYLGRQSPPDKINRGPRHPVYCSSQQVRARRSSENTDLVEPWEEIWLWVGMSNGSEGVQNYSFIACVVSTPVRVIHSVLKASVVVVLDRLFSHRFTLSLFCRATALDG
ncbi:hypothetical protein E2C01_064660 [Portunus trituberculatus]|uniref:Uncharacterized protein n=1 Tax=Portunus trituberculatus TaxID=210409 RepID=A0A5B7HCF0_PORTR|nr:hypothetical protein [Portunus trituberculatus]